MKRIGKIASVRLVAYRNPLKDSKFNLLQEHIDLLYRVLYARKIHSANCSNQSDIAADFLWRNPKGIKSIQLVAMKNYQHAFLLINLDPHANLNDSSTWGNAWILDPWYEEGIIFHARHFKKMIKKIVNYAKIQAILLNLHYIEYNVKVTKDNGFELELSYTIYPDKDLYPSYQKNDCLENYIDVDTYLDPRFEYDLSYPYKTYLDSISIDDNSYLSINKKMKSLKELLKNLKDIIDDLDIHLLINQLIITEGITIANLKINSWHNVLQNTITLCNNYYSIAWESNHLDKNNIKILKEISRIANLMISIKHNSEYEIIKSNDEFNTLIKNYIYEKTHLKSHSNYSVFGQNNDKNEIKPKPTQQPSGFKNGG